MLTTPVANPNIEVLRDILEATGRYRYHIQFESIKANHLLHALIAQHQLGASDDRLREVSETLPIRDKLEPAHERDVTLERITRDNWQNLRGKRTRYNELAEFFDNELERFDGDRKALLVEYVPHLIDSMSSVATHGLIHLGYALRSPSDQSIADALAFMVFTYGTLGHMEANEHKTVDNNELPPHPYSGCNELVQLLKFVSKDALDLLKNLIEADGLKSKPGYFTRRMIILQTHVDMQKQLHSYARHISMIERVPDDQLLELAHGLSIATLLAYANTQSEPDNFFLLHGVTSSWALREILRYLKDDISPKLIRSILYAHVLTVLATYLIEELPEIILKDGQMPLFNIDKKGLNGNQNDLPNWSEIIKLAIDSDDEHLTKLVFSCYDDEQYYGASIPNIYQSIAACKVGLLKWN